MSLSTIAIQPPGPVALEQPRLLAGSRDDQHQGFLWRRGDISVASVRKPLDDAENEDALLVMPLSGEGLLMAVADGCGGMRGAQEAAATALGALAEEISRDPGTGPSRILAGFDAANRAVLSLGIGAATTLAVVVVTEGVARAYHAGDSVILIVGQRGRVRFQTISHSPTGYGVEAGLMTEQEALTHAERSSVLNVVGCESMRVEVGPPIPLRERDSILLASDGLCDNLVLDEIVSSVRCGPGPKSVDQLAQLSRTRMLGLDDAPHGHPDDLTIVLYRPRQVG